MSRQPKDQRLVTETLSQPPASPNAPQTLPTGHRGTPVRNSDSTQENKPLGVGFPPPSGYTPPPQPRPAAIPTGDARHAPVTRKPRRS